LNGKQQRIRERCEEDFLFFVRYFCTEVNGWKFSVNWHHKIIAKTLCDVFYGRKKHVILNIPPGHSKSELVVRLFVPWSFMMSKVAMCRFLHISYSKKLVNENSAAVQKIINSNLYQEMWPHAGIDPKKRGVEEWKTTAGGEFRAVAADGQITGFRAGRLGMGGFSGAMLIDDPQKTQDGLSETMRKKINSNWHITFKSRFASPDVPCVLIMQRVHEHDFTHELLKDPEFDFEHVVLPAIVDEDTPKERALWPELVSLDSLKKREKAHSYTFAGQWQQRPSPLGGGLIRGEWFKTYKMLPKLKYRAMFVDTAQKSKEYNDYQVAGVYGLGEDGFLYIIDFMREKFDAYLLEQKVPAFWEKHKADKNGKMRFMGVEDKVSGTTLIQKIRNEIKPKIPVRDIQRSRDKLSRVMDVQGYMESGYVKVPDSAPWKFDFIKECESFTPDDTHANDDMVDTLCDAIEEMLHKKTTRVWEVL
jgi:predicted phage terminase large subunit-like protein